MRLIDADELIKDRVENDPVVIAVKCAPTAYDVDKVVERLAANSILAQADDEPFVMFDDAVEIVKSGGIERNR